MINGGLVEVIVCIGNCLEFLCIFYKVFFIIEKNWFRLDF